MKAKARDALAYYSEMIDLHDLLPINTGLSSAQESTMISLLGAPQLPLTRTDQPDRASPLVKSLKVHARVATNISVDGIGAAVDSLGAILAKAFAAEKAKGHDLQSVLGTEGMLNVRYRKPTSGRPSTQISNHAWGTAIDFKLVGQDAPGNTAGQIPRFIAVLVPVFNQAGWYSGIAFHDTMHFEVADETIRKWSAAGLLKPQPQAA